MKQKLIKILNWPFITISNAIDSQNMSFFNDKLVPWWTLLLLLATIFGITSVLGAKIAFIFLFLLPLATLLPKVKQYWHPSFVSTPVMYVSLPALMLIIIIISLIDLSDLFNDGYVSEGPVAKRGIDGSTALVYTFVILTGATSVIARHIKQVLRNFKMILWGIALNVLFIMFSIAIDSIVIGKNQSYYPLESLLKPFISTNIPSLILVFIGVTMASVVISLVCLFFISISCELLFKQLFLKLNQEIKLHKWLSFTIATVLVSSIVVFCTWSYIRAGFSRDLGFYLIGLFITNVAIMVQYFVTKNIYYTALLLIPLWTGMMTRGYFDSRGSWLTDVWNMPNPLGVFLVNKYMPHGTLLEASLGEKIQTIIILQLPELLKAILFCLLIAGIYKLINRYKNKELTEVKT